MGNDPAAWMIPGAALLAVILFFVLGAYSERRRRATWPTTRPVSEWIRPVSSAVRPAGTEGLFGAALA